MNQQKKLPAEIRLNKVRSEFEVWCANRKNRKPIPSEDVNIKNLIIEYQCMLALRQQPVG
jgi:hypothetical protein